jgi:hypothetical protein
MSKIMVINVEGIVDEQLLVSKTTVNPANWSKIRYALGLEIEYEEYLDVDRDLSICDNLTDANIIEIVQQDRENSEIEDNYGIPNEEAVISQEIRPEAALRVLKKNLLRQDNVPQDIFNAYYISATLLLQVRLTR